MASLQYNDYRQLKKFLQYEYLTTESGLPNSVEEKTMERFLSKHLVYCIDRIEDLYAATSDAWDILQRR